MFVAVYRWCLKPGYEEQFRRSWRQITEAYLHCGSGGSCLFQAGDGTWVAVARWPDRETRSRCFLERSLEEAHLQMQAAIESSFDTLELEAVDNLWTMFPEQSAQQNKK